MQNSIYKKENEKPLISIIVPVYNVEKYLDKCLESITNQIYKNLEIIIVDDGSPDNCGSICDSWKKKDNRIIVIHQNNMGLSGARNSGMKIAKGKYLAFVDSDDIISDSYISLMYDNMVKNKADLVGCEATSDLEKLYSCKTANDTKFTIDITINPLLYYMEKDNDAVWHRLYAAELLRDIWFEVGAENEDIIFTYNVFRKSKKYVRLFCKLYYWNLVPPSLSRGKVKSIKNHSEEVVNDLIDRKANYKIINAAKVRRDMFTYRIITRVLRFGTANEAIQKSFDCAINSYVTTFRRDLRLILKAFRFRVVDKAQIILICISFNLYKKMYTFLKNGVC